MKIFWNDIKKMSTKEHSYYWIVPSVLMSVFMIFYFSEVPPLVSLICPPANREWGLLENLQLVIIFCILLLSIYAFLKTTNIIQKLGFIVIGCFTLFIFLEEMDYGKHFAQLIGGQTESYLMQYIPDKSIHGQGNNAINFKRIVKIMIILIFIISPFLKSRIKNPYLQYLIPQARIAIVAVLTIVVLYVPRYIVESGLRKDGGLGRNIAEFSEVMMYYVFLIYLYQLVFVKQHKWP